MRPSYEAIWTYEHMQMHTSVNIFSNRVPEVNEKNTLFIHLLVWEARYETEFLKMILNSIFISTWYCLHVVLIIPPGFKLDAVEMFDQRMKKFFPVNAAGDEMVQTLYVSLRQQEDPKLKIRRVVYDKPNYAIAFSSSYKCSKISIEIM